MELEIHDNDALVRERSANEGVDALEAYLRTLEPVDMPVKHTFTPGLYSREIFMPAGTILVSKIHKTEHPFVITKGSVTVWTQDVGCVKFVAPYSGITTPGTRRVLYIHEDTTWTTFHPTQETDLARIEEQLIFKHTPAIEDNQAVEALKAARVQFEEVTT